ncbi:MAG TPA: peptidylprolyl isomerase [Candidatus Omnitrophota bacterium]|nr:peptidylprolyl isomerase [Candidatus Omnitrophota bacterium]
MSKQVITFHYELKDESGKIMDSSKGGTPLSFLEGSDQIIPGLEEALILLKKGEAKDVRVPYEDAYGPYDQKLVAQVALNQFPAGAPKVGDVFQIEKDGMHRLITVIEINGDNVTIDGNHPMAGKNLNFWVQIVERRDATSDEIDHGHAHVAGGHHHH